MERLTKTYEDGTHNVADTLPCGENSWEFKRILLEALGEYEDLGVTPEQVREIDRLYIEKCREVAKLKKKQTPMKPVTWDLTNRADCPVCGGMVRGIGKPFGDWCSKCGQKLDWED